MKWVIVYADGSYFTSDDGAPEEAPVCGVQVVYNADESVGFKIEKSRFGYWGWRDDYGWLGFQTESGYWDYMTQPGWKLCLFGRTVRDDRWHEIQKRAGEIATGMKKSGWWTSEKGRFIEP